MTGPKATHHIANDPQKGHPDIHPQ